VKQDYYKYDYIKHHLTTLDQIVAWPVSKLTTLTNNPDFSLHWHSKDCNLTWKA